MLVRESLTAIGESGQQILCGGSRETGDLAWNFDGFDDVGNYGVGRCAVEFGFGAQSQAMPQHGRGDVADVVGRHEIAPVNRGERF